MERLSRDVTVGASCLLHHIMSQCEEGVKVLSRIIFYLLLGKLVSRLRTPRSRTAARWKKLLTGNYVIIQVYFTSHNISVRIYLGVRAVGKMRTGDTGCVCARARVRNRVFLVENRVSRVLFRFDYSFGRRVNFEKIATESLFPIYSRKQTIFSESFGFVCIQDDS